MDIKQLIGARIKSLRTRKRLTQEELSERVGINAKYLSSIERGLENPTLNTFLAIAEALEVSFDEIFCDLATEDKIAGKELIEELLKTADESQIKMLSKITLAVMG